SSLSRTIGSSNSLRTRPGSPTSTALIASDRRHRTHDEKSQANMRTASSSPHNTAANPCPCGHLGDSRFACRCSPYDLHRYASRLSGPLLDRVDLYVQVERLPADELAGAADGEPTAQVRARVLAARALQRRRQGAENGRLATADVGAHCPGTPPARRPLMAALDRLGLR